MKYNKKIKNYKNKENYLNIPKYHQKISNLFYTIIKIQLIIK